jgi:hypothetical protein
MVEAAAYAITRGGTQAWRSPLPVLNESCRLSLQQRGVGAVIDCGQAAHKLLR